MAGHSKSNGEQTRALMRDMRAYRSQMRTLSRRIDSAVALADKEVGVRSSELGAVEPPPFSATHSPIENRQSAIALVSR